MGGTAPSLENRWHGQRRIQAVNVPIEGAYAARDDGPDVRCRLLAAMAQDRLAVFSLLEEVGFVGAISLSTNSVVRRRRRRGKMRRATYLAVLLFTTSS
jgi:hypothetical protein